MAKHVGIIILSTLICALSVSGQAITGRVVSAASTPAPISGVTVALRVKGISTTTDNAGQFTLNLATGALRAAQRTVSNMRFEKNTLMITSAHTENVRIEAYNLCGEKLFTIMDQSFGPGTHALPITGMFCAGGMCLLKINKGNERHIVTITPFGATLGFGASSRTAVGEASVSSATQTAAVEVLTVTKQGYHPRALDINAYTANNMGDIVLSTIAEDSVLIEHKVDSLLALMNNTQKAGQMTEAMNNAITPADVTQYGFGSVFNGGETPSYTNNPAGWATRLDALQDGALASTLKIPMIYGIDAVHGNGKVPGCTIFPHNIGLGCTGDTSLVEQVGRITASECAAMGIHLAFAPCVSSVRDERWGRTYEGFGETPEINGKMGAAFTRGLQGDGDLSKPSAIGACVKHYLGDGGTAGGVNGGITTLSDASMRAIHFPQYIACAHEKMASVMPSYSTWSRNGKSIKQSLDSVALTGMLKNEQHWDGFALSDYDAIIQTPLGTTYTPQTVGPSIMAGMDMAMVASRANALAFITAVTSAIPTYLSQARLDDAVRRILRIKFRMNLWSHAKSQTALLNLVGNADHRAVARDAVRKSMVLLKNTSAALPLKTTEKVVVVGPWATSMGAQCGGWTIGWQGLTTYTPSDVGGGQTIFQGLQQVGGASNVTSDPQGTNLTAADKIVVVVGEIPYAEGSGDNTNPTLASCQNAALIDKCYATNKPVIVVMISGRPLLIADKLAMCSAFVAAWLPGSEGIGVADVLYGNYNFTGKITHTWANTLGQIPINTGTPYSDEPHGSGGTPLFPYGYGLTY
jgi:beta-glucosidase